MSDTLGLSQRKLPSALEAAIVRAAQSSAGASSLVPTVGAALDAATVVNGGFDVADPAAAGFGWQTLGGAAVEGGHAVLTETPSLASRFVQQLVAPADARVLTFTIVSAHFEPSGLGPQDAFEVALLDPSVDGGRSPAAIGLADTDALLNLQADGLPSTTRAPSISTPARRRLDARPHRPRRSFHGRPGHDALLRPPRRTARSDSRVAIDDVQVPRSGGSRRSRSPTASRPPRTRRSRSIRAANDNVVQWAAAHRRADERRRRTATLIRPRRRTREVHHPQPTTSARTGSNIASATASPILRAGRR